MCTFRAYLHNLDLSALHHKCSKQLMLSKQTNEPIHSASVNVLEPQAKLFSDNLENIFASKRQLGMLGIIIYRVKKQSMPQRKCDTMSCIC